LKTVARELENYYLDLVLAQEVRWDDGCGRPADDYTFLYTNGNGSRHLGTGFFVTGESYQQLRGWNLLVIGCHIYNSMMLVGITE
jgi:hypothetical protein